MRKFVVVGAIIVFCFSSAVVVPQQNGGTQKDPCDDATTQYDLDVCTYREYKKADAKLNKTYQELMSSLTEREDGIKLKQKLKQAQLRWIEYRDADCDTESSFYDGGTLQPTISNMCMTSATQERTKRLKDLIAETKK